MIAFQAELKITIYCFLLCQKWGILSLWLVWVQTLGNHRINLLLENCQSNQWVLQWNCGKIFNNKVKAPECLVHSIRATKRRGLHILELVDWWK